MARSPRPNPANAIQARNPLALTGFLLSLVFPIGALLTKFTTGGVYWTYAGVFAQLGYILDFLGIPALVAAIITGHLALSRANQYPQARRGLALAGLVVGYLSLVLVIGFAIRVLTFPNKFHIVY